MEEPSYPRPQFPSELRNPQEETGASLEHLPLDVVVFLLRELAETFSNNMLILLIWEKGEAIQGYPG